MFSTKCNIIIFFFLLKNKGHKGMRNLYDIDIVEPAQNFWRQLNTEDGVAYIKPIKLHT